MQRPSLNEILIEVMLVHRICCPLPYAPDLLFDLAADVESYPEFMPWWIAARVHKREGDAYYTDQIVGLGMLRQRFRSKTVLCRPRRIDVTSSDGPIRDLHLTWLFDPLPDDACQVALTVDLELRPLPIQGLFNRGILRRVGSIMSAFETRARGLYDPAAAPRMIAGDRAPGDSSV